MNPDGLRAQAPKPGEPADKRKRRWLLLAGLVLTLILAVTIGRPAFSRWQHRRLIQAAGKAFASGDLRSACLSAREALLKNPASTPACAILARVAEHENSPAAILWRQRLVELNPKQSSRLLELAACAANLGETFIAEQALSQIPEGERDTLAFHATAGALAIAEKQPARAEKEFQRAAALDPKDENLRLNLATIQLALAHPGAATEAFATLERLRQNPQFRHAALRALLTDARRGNNPERARSLANELRQSADASLGDILLWLDELRQEQSPEFDGELRSLQAATAKSGGAIYSVVTWMNARGLAAQSIQWCESLPAKVRAQMPVPLGEAEARTALADWKQLREIVRGADWADLEFLRLAIHARVLYETDGQRRRTEFHTMWESAKNSTRGNPNALMMLGRLVKGWGWKDEATEAWWLAARNGTGNRAALKALFANYSAEKNTRELYRVARRVFEMEPANLVAKNNVAALALLIGEDVDEAHRLAAELYTQTPAQSVIASTHALSLCKQKRAAEAVAVLKKLPPAAFADPSIAACYGVALKDAGDAAAARPFLETADRAKAQLFPEEAAMVADALQRRP